MKVIGIILFVFAALNLIVAFAAMGSGYGDAAGGKFASALLVGLVGGVFYYFGSQKNKKS